MVVVINGKRKTIISATILTAKTVHFSVAYASYNELTVKVGDEIIENEEYYLSFRKNERVTVWSFNYNSLDFRFIRYTSSIQLVQVINGEEYTCKNFSVEWK
jgi:hypothetical protein